MELTVTEMIELPIHSIMQCANRPDKVIVKIHKYMWWLSGSQFSYNANELVDGNTMTSGLGPFRLIYMPTNDTQKG